VKVLPVKDVLVQLMSEHDNMTAAELARQTGVPQPTITRIRKGQSIDPDTRTLEPLANYFGITVPELRGEVALREERSQYTTPMFARAQRSEQVPVISWVQAGNWNHASDPYSVGDAAEWMLCPVPHGNSSFALLVRGISMEPEFHDGDYIFVDPAVEPKHRSFVIVRLAHRDETTFKQLIVEGARRFLKPLNPQWPDPIIELTDDAVICGVVIFKGKKV